MSALPGVDVSVRGLAKSYGPLRAVDGVSFDVPAGSVTALLGGNGAGKSTSIRLMLGLSTGAGRTLFGGRPLADHADPMRVVGAFLGAPAFHPSRSARNHLRCLAVGAGLSPGRVGEVLELLGMTAYAGKRPRGFSTGMRQRLGIAAAVLADPSVLVLDEPVNGLDPQAVIGMRELVAEHARRGGTVLMATHLLAEAELVADRAVVVAAGRVVREGAVADLLGHGSAPPTLRAACSDPPRLAAAVAGAGGTALLDGPDAVTVDGLEPRALAELALAAGVAVWELSPVRRSLEDVFVDAVGTADPSRATLGGHRAAS